MILESLCCGNICSADQVIPLVYFRCDPDFENYRFSHSEILYFSLM